MKKSRRRLLGILLAASMTAAAVFPVQGMAAEGTNSRYGYEEEEIDLGERARRRQHSARGRAAAIQDINPGTRRERRRRFASKKQR